MVVYTRYIFVHICEAQERNSRIFVSDAEVNLVVKRIFMRTRSLQEGMKIDQAIVDRRGRILIARGALMDEYLIDSLLKLGINGVYIREG